MDILGFSVEKVVVIAAIAGFFLGPERLARLVTGGTALLRRLRQQTDRARAAMREELGPEVDDIDWRRLDPRQYDPRRIISDALFAPDAAAPTAAAPAVDRVRRPALDPTGPAAAATDTLEERQ